MIRIIVAVLAALMMAGGAIAQSQRDVNLDLNGRTFTLTTVTTEEEATKCGQETGLAGLVTAVSIDNEGRLLGWADEVAYCLTESSK